MDDFPRIQFDAITYDSDDSLDNLEVDNRQAQALTIKYLGMTHADGIDLNGSPALDGVSTILPHHNVYLDNDVDVDDDAMFADFSLDSRKYLQSHNLLSTPGSSGPLLDKNTISALPKL